MGKNGKRYATLLSRTVQEYPRFNICLRSDVWWLRAIFWLLVKIRGHNYNGFTTTIGSTMYVSDNWHARTDHQKYIVLRHERQHVRQFHTWPIPVKWLWPVNHILFSISYLLLPLPIFITMRAHFEREGYLQNMLVLNELNGPLDEKQIKHEASFIADIFSGATYLWMWRRKPAYTWAVETMRAINAGDIKNDDYIPG